MSFLILIFGMMANAKIDVSYGAQGEKQKSIAFELEQKNKVFSFNELSTMCQIDYQKGKMILFCDHKENGSGAILSCNGEESVHIFQDKKNKKRYVASIKCSQDKI